MPSSDGRRPSPLFCRPAGTRGDRVLILCPTGLDYIAAFFGCQLAGQVAVPAYPPRNARHMGRLQAILADAGASAILMPGDLSGRLIEWAGGSERLPRLVAIDAISSDAASADARTFSIQEMSGQGKDFQRVASRKTALATIC